jgi:uncharacterized protein (DUF1015 family)
MADVRPFRGIRYNTEAIGDLSLVVAPPYDVISPEEHDGYYNKHPYNVIRLILNRPKEGELPDKPYDRAAEFLERWIAQRILIQDPVPGIYVYRQRYLYEGEYKECTGMIARVRVVDFAEGVVLPHEEIMPKPFEDRMKLLERTKTNLSTVYTLYSDPAEKLKAPILAEMDKFPIAQFQTADGIANDLWSVTDEKFTKRVTRFLENKKLYIADGHHRYQTAFEYSRRLRESGEITEDDDPRNFLMVMIVEMENPGLSVLPVHRIVVKPDVDPAAVLGKLEDMFAVAELEPSKGARSGQVFQMLGRLREAGEAGHVYGMFSSDGKFRILTPRPGFDLDREFGGKASEAYRSLDVTVLHRLVVEKVLGIAPDRKAVEDNLVFTRDPLAAISMVDSGKAPFAFFMNPPRVEQVRGVADSGEKMPQKSTYFHPKPCSGVVMNRITEW